MNEIERAELIQSLKAYLIPSSLFVACLIGAAGTFLIREGYAVGWAFVGVCATIIISSMWAFICFQNKHRYEGRFLDEDKSKPGAKARSVAQTSTVTIDASPEAVSDASVAPSNSAPVLSKTE